MSKAGYYGKILEINLSTSKVKNIPINEKDLKMFVGGRGLGMKILTDRLNKPGIDPLSPDNPLLFMPGPFSALPIPSASRTCVVTKSPLTSPIKSKYKHASTVAYSNMGGFFGPEIRFAGYDGLIITGKAKKPVYIQIDDDKVEFKDAGKFWGMGTDEFDRKFIDELGDRRYRTCYIGPAGENLVPYSCVITTASRAAGRSGTGCVMGSKNLKAIAVKGSKQPNIANPIKFNELLAETRAALKIAGSTKWWRYGGTANVLTMSSNGGTMAVKNYREGTYNDVEKIGVEEVKKKNWTRSYACFLCPLSCKKSGTIKTAPYTGISHDGPEYETGTMLGANLLISDLDGLLKLIYMGDNYGVDIISIGNVIGFLMEAYEKKLIDKKFLDGIDLKWGSVDAAMQMMKKIVYKEGIGEVASKGVKVLAEKIGQGSEKFAIHVKGQELAAWNVHVDKGFVLSYTMANRGACHMNGGKIEEQNANAMHDATGLCRFAVRGFGGNEQIVKFLSAIIGENYTVEDYLNIGERIFNLERMFNCKEGFIAEDDILPERFFTEPLTVGEHKGAVLTKEEVEKMKNDYYLGRSWDAKTGKPGKEKLKELLIES